MNITSTDRTCQLNTQEEADKIQSKIWTYCK